MILTNLANAGVSLVSAALVAQELVPDPADVVERYGLAGALGLVLGWVLFKLSKQMDENTRAIKEGSVATAEAFKEMAAEIRAQSKEVAEALRQKP